MTGLRVTFKVINPEDFRKNLDATRALGDLGELNKQLSEYFAKYINTKQVQEQLKFGLSDTKRGSRFEIFVGRPEQTPMP